MPSKFWWTDSTSGISSATGCVEGSWSCILAHAFSASRKVTQALGQRVASAWREHGHEGRERLVEPQVVPPAHGDEVAEPHVRHLVQDGLGPPLVVGVGDLAAEDVDLGEGDRARVLHRAGRELRDEQLVVLAERVGRVEHVLEVVQALPGDLEDLVGVEVLGQRAAHVEPELHRRRCSSVDLGVGAGDDGGDVGAACTGGDLELPPAGGALVGPLEGAPVGDDDPFLGGVDGQLEGGLEVGLVEAGVDLVGVERLELAVQVDAVVGRVDEAVQALALVAVAPSSATTVTSWSPAGRSGSTMRVGWRPRRGRVRRRRVRPARPAGRAVEEGGRRARPS